MSAIISTCGLYRYRLDRAIPTDLFKRGSDGIFQGKTIGFVAINPSTADHAIDDPTVKKWIGFCNRWGSARFIVGNVFAFRATDVRDLRSTHNPRGVDNDSYLTQIASEADILVPCWGNRDKVDRKLHAHFDATLGLLLSTGKPMMHFGLTNSGDPKHPLMLGYDTVMTPWATT